MLLTTELLTFWGLNNKETLTACSIPSSPGIIHLTWNIYQHNRYSIKATSFSGEKKHEKIYGHLNGLEKAVDGWICFYSRFLASRNLDS